MLNKTFIDRTLLCCYSGVLFCYCCCHCSSCCYCCCCCCCLLLLFVVVVVVVVVFMFVLGLFEQVIGVSEVDDAVIIVLVSSILRREGPHDNGGVRLRCDLRVLDLAYIKERR